MIQAITKVTEEEVLAEIARLSGQNGPRKAANNAAFSGLVESVPKVNGKVDTSAMDLSFHLGYAVSNFYIFIA